MFRSVLIANRGEIALRVIRACKEAGIRTVAICSEADRTSPHLDHADEVVCIGGSRSAESYLNMEAIIQAAIQYDCQALHPGYGFLAENPLFSDLCTQSKVTFIGPPPHAIRLMGDKARARATMTSLGLDPIPGSEGTLRDLDHAREAVSQIGCPVLLKASAGGGGKGMRVVEKEGDLEHAFSEASLEADKAFANPALYMEKYITRGRHIEFQILADVFGNAVHLGERECSVQRNHQKLVEESPSPVIDETTRRDLGKKVAEAVAAIGYVNAGTVEFLRDSDGNLYFMEMNTRLQVEHPVTEMVTGFDIVAEQLRIAANCPLSITQEDIELKGHAIEVRINAEDPDRAFKPDPGRITAFEPPELDSVRIDTHITQGYTIPPFYDSLICKLIGHGKNRNAAIKTVIHALENFKIEGVKTTVPIHIEILSAGDFKKGTYDTGFIPDLLAKKGQADNG
ncbi:MAG: acetyl-CoA carboxylase biotin carboxylase subunit [Candidatus Eisenbacteria bacterium]